MITVYTITEREGEKKNIWTRIGVAFKNKDGSLNCKLNALPTNGTIHIRKEEEEKKEKEESNRGVM